MMQNILHRILMVYKLHYFIVRIKRYSPIWTKVSSYTEKENKTKNTYGSAKSVGRAVSWILDGALNFLS